MNIHSVPTRPRRSAGGTHPAPGRKPQPGRKPVDPGVPAGKRDAVLAAALALFTERTYEGTPMPAVAQRAGIGVGTIYRYFPSKEALGNAVFQQGKREMLRYLTRAAH